MLDSKSYKKGMCGYPYIPFSIVSPVVHIYGFATSSSIVLFSWHGTIFV
jgi:hypothetical protein